MLHSSHDKTLTLRDLANEVLRLADENPDAVYCPPNDSDACFYVHTTGLGEAIPDTGCVFGRALQNLGVSTNDLRHRDLSIERLLVRLKEFPKVRFIDDVPNEFADAQIEQDRGTPWGEAVKPLRLFMGQE